MTPTVKGCSSKKPHPLVDGINFFSVEGGGIQTAQIRGSVLSDVPRNPVWVMFMHSSLSGVTGGLPVSVFYAVDFDVLAADFTSVDKF